MTTREDALRRTIKDLTKDLDQAKADLAALRGGPVAGFLAYAIGPGERGPDDGLLFTYWFNRGDLMRDPERALDAINCQMRAAVFTWIRRNEKGAA